MLLGSYPLPHELVANREGGRLVEVVVGGYVAVFDQGLVEVAVERPLDSCHVLQLGNVSHGDLLLAVAGALRGRHGWRRCLREPGGVAGIDVGERCSGPDRGAETSFVQVSPASHVLLPASKDIREGLSIYLPTADL